MTSSSHLKDKGTIAIVGAGPAGATLARLLGMRGFPVRVFERDANSTARPQGGSLDLRPDSGQRAIDAAGLGELFARASRREAKAFKMIDSQGAELPGAGAETHDDAGPEIDRGDLRQLLLDSLPPGTVAWDHLVRDVHSEADGRWRLEFEEQAPVVADLVVGADGVGSKIRRHLTSARPRYTGITMLATNIRPELWRNSELADTVGEGSVMFAGGGNTVFVQRCARDVILLYYSMKVAEDWPQREGFRLEDTKSVMSAVDETYRDWSPQLMEMLTQNDGKFQRWPVTVMTPDDAWATKPGLTIIGDASHVMPPFTGKGVNLAMLDAFELADGLTADPSASLSEVVARFEKGMQDRTRKEIGECLEVGRQIYGLEVDFGQRAAA